MKIHYFIIGLIIAFCAYCFDMQASNRVKIVTVGGGRVQVGSERNHQKIVEQMKNYWKGEFDKALIHKPDLILLTEVCDSPIGLSNEEQFTYYRFRGNQVQDYFSSVAKANRCYIVFGTIREANGLWYNSCVVLDREGKEAGVYFKNYPTVYEMPTIKPGTETPLIQCDFGTIACVICFDLNFDELRDRYAALKPDLVLFPSMYHGGLEQGKWAYSCRSYFACAYGFNTCPSEIRNPFGDVIASSIHGINYAVATVNLDRKMAHEDFNKDKIINLKKKYGDKVIISNPGKLGVQMITSEHDQISAADMAKEFNIELLDDYFDRSRQDRVKNLK